MASERHSIDRSRNLLTKCFDFEFSIGLFRSREDLLVVWKAWNGSEETGEAAIIHKQGTPYETV